MFEPAHVVVIAVFITTKITFVFRNANLNVISIMRNKPDISGGGGGRAGEEGWSE